MQVEDILHERGIDICHETVRYWWNRFGPLFTNEFAKRRIRHGFGSMWRWHLYEVFININGNQFYLWRTIDQEGEVLEAYVSRCRNCTPSGPCGPNNRGNRDSTNLPIEWT